MPGMTSSSTFSASSMTSGPMPSPGMTARRILNPSFDRPNPDRRTLPAATAAAARLPSHRGRPDG